MGRIRDRDDRLRGHGRHLRVPRRLERVTRGLRRHPQPAAPRVLRRHPAADRLPPDCSSGQRVRNCERGAPDRRATTAKNVGRRLRDFRAGVYMQTLLRDPAAGVMHSLIYFGFLILFAVTTVLEIDHQLPESAKFLHGDVYQGYCRGRRRRRASCSSSASCWAIVRRYVQRPYRIRIKTKPEHAVDPRRCSSCSASPGSSTEALRIALEGRPAFEKWSFVGYPLSALSTPHGRRRSTRGTRCCGASHVASFLVFLVMLPVTMLRHMFTSPLNMYLRDRDRPKGAMKAMPNLMETELETFGASTVEDFTWKQLLDTDACTMCGRCTSVCPAHATGKPLDPREIVLKTGEVMAATGQRRRCRRRSASIPRSPSPPTRCSSASRRGGLGVHVVQGVRRDLPGEHRDPRQDPRHAALPVADGVELPDRARQRVPLDGEPEQPVGHEPGRARRTGRAGSTTS